MHKLKVYYPVPDLGPSIRRRQRKLIELAPEVVEFVQPEHADIQIQSICGANEIRNVVCERYIIYLHNAPSLLSIIPEDFYNVLGRAMMLLSWSDYPSVIKTPYKFTRAPQGADSEVFRSRREPRTYAVGTTGFLGTYWKKGRVEGEPILEVHQAAKLAGKLAIQIGPDIEGVMGFTGYVEDDPVVASHYSKCRYVSGLRWWGGFECPSLEGLLCGCRPICFDLPDERFWWGEHAVFVPHDPETLVARLTEVLHKEPEPVGTAERDYLARKYNWKTIAKDFWDLVLGLA